MCKEVGVEEMVVIGRGIDQHTTFDDYVRQKNILYYLISACTWQYYIIFM